MKLNLQPVKSLVAVLALLTLTACAGGGKLQSVALPNAPECMNPVPVPNVKAGDDARLALLKTDKALGQANGRLVCSRKWYREVQRSYSPSQ
jgi:type IV pilus biogenesis protein CpaD/CtpE